MLPIDGRGGGRGEEGEYAPIGRKEGEYVPIGRNAVNALSATRTVHTQEDKTICRLAIAERETRPREERQAATKAIQPPHRQDEGD